MEENSWRCDEHNASGAACVLGVEMCDHQVFYEVAGRLIIAIQSVAEYICMYMGVQ